MYDQPGILDRVRNRMLSCVLHVSVFSRLASAFLDGKGWRCWACRFACFSAK